MFLIARLTLLALVAAALLALGGVGSPVVVAHLAFALGVVPLIFAAMLHFVPVLTRTGDPSSWLARLPLFAQADGVLIVASMQGMLPYDLVYPAAAVDLIFCLILLRWIIGRAKATLGSPHPGWRWYAAALGCLIMALFAVLLMALWPEGRANWRLFHLHLNVVGLVGLAAFGTLPVLLPTALGLPDPKAANWLRHRLWLLAGGALIVSLGAAFAWELSVMGGALVLVAAISLFGQWLRCFGLGRLIADGVSASLLAALLGFVACLVAGALHAAGVVHGRPTLWAWAAGFLLPLVSGALSQLLPVWRWPGPQSAARLVMRDRMAVTGRWRGLLFLAGALALLAGWSATGVVLTGVALLLFLSGLLQGVRVSGPTR